MKQKKLLPAGAGTERNSGIEAIKVMAILIIIINHTFQTFESGSQYTASQDYVLKLTTATTSIQQIICTILRYGGSLGNNIFFVCSAWFLLDSKRADKKKWISMFSDIWFISLFILGAASLSGSCRLSTKIVIKSLFPVTMENNWYMTCYLLFYPIHPALNSIIDRMEQKQLLRVTIVLLVLYAGISYVIHRKLFMSWLVLWITLYFTIAYMKKYLKESSEKRLFNVLLIVTGLLGNTGMVLITNFLGLRVELLHDKLLYWNVNNSPFLIMTAVGMLNSGRKAGGKNYLINRLSGLSMLIYLFHENLIIRTCYRPQWVDFVYQICGQNYLMGGVILALVIFTASAAVSFVYEKTVQKPVHDAAWKMYTYVAKAYQKLETVLLSFR